MLFVAISLFGCATKEGQKANARKDILNVASFDFGCDKNKIKVKFLKYDTTIWGDPPIVAGVIGCGKKAKYVNAGTATAAKWVKDD